MNSNSRSVPASWIGKDRQKWLAAAIAVGVLLLAFLMGQRASSLWLGLIVAAIGGILLLARPVLGVFAITLVALVPRMEISTGTEVNLNPVTLLIPVVTVVWLVSVVLKRRLKLASSPANQPLVLFLAAGLMSLLIGRATWDPIVPVNDNFLLVQLAQWAIFAFSALAFWLSANLITNQVTLKRLTMMFLLVAGTVAILRFIPGVSAPINRVVTLAFIRTPLWVLLVALGGGQLLFNPKLSAPWRVFLGVVLLVAVYYAFVHDTDADSNWVGLAAVLGSLVWLRFPRLRWPAAILVLILVSVGVLFPAVYEFAGGYQEWTESGASRLLLIERVVDVTLRNPITGLGPAAYRPYANATPLKYLNAYWLEPQVNSHNNYVDLFAHTGLLGMILFFWSMAEIVRSAWRLSRRYREDFAAGYVNGMLAAIAAMAVIMLMLDWFLPFVYNIGFSGFQASVLVWLFMGGLVALDNVDSKSISED